MSIQSKHKACAVLVAGGMGKRFGSTDGKQLIEVAGRPLLSWTLEAFDAARLIEHIVVVCPPDRQERIEAELLANGSITTPVSFAESGAERQDSSRNGLAAVPAAFDVVAVHDGARPLILPEVIDAAIGTLFVKEQLDGVVCGQPAVDTLKRVEVDGTFIDTPARSEYWTVQTPQVFWTTSLKRAFAWSEENNVMGTDEASLVEGMGGTVQGFESPRDNIKVTLPEDLVLVEAVLRARQLASKQAEQGA